jgi:hypothetical protein
MAETERALELQIRNSAQKLLRELSKQRELKRGLKKHGTLRLRLESDTKGWAITLGNLGRGEPSIEIWLDHLALADTYSFWYGIRSTNVNPSPMRDAANPVRSIFSNDVTWLTNRWRYKQPLADNEFGYPVFEYWRKQNGEWFMGAYTTQAEFRAARAADFLVTLCRVYRHASSDEVADIRKIGNGPEKETMKEQLIEARRGQGKFREALDTRWKNSCAVTYCKIREGLRASHIKPWKASSNEERLDPENGILLTANLDAMFDQHLISFDDRGRILISHRIDRTQQRLLGIPRKLGPLSLSAREREYLRGHRKMFLMLNQCAQDERME